MKASDAVIQIMKEWDINHIYGYPGDSVNNLVESLRTHQDEVDFIQVRHEEVGALAAAAEAKLTGKVGVCLSIGGPGAIHLLNGMYDAKLDGAPMVVITGQISHDLLGTEHFQEVNLEKLFEPATVFNRRVTSGKQIQPLLQQAIKEAYAHNGVAALTVPDDIFKEAVGPSIVRSSTYTTPQFIPHEHELIRAADLFAEAKKPVILAGKGAFPAKEWLIPFAEKIAAPIVISLRGKGLIPDSHPYNLGNLGQIGTKPAFEAMDETDLLIMIGTSYPYRDFLPDQAPAIQIDNDPTQIGKRYPVDVGLVASSEHVLQWFNTHLEDNEDKRFLQSCQQNMKNWHKHLEDIATYQEEKPMQGPQVIHMLQDYVDDNAVLTVDVGNVSSWVTRFFQMTNQRLIISSWLATMGSGLPAAIAAKLNEPDTQVVSVCGDGGFSMVMQDFLTAVKYDLPITVLILNNKKIGMIQFEQEELGNIPYEVDLENMDYAKFAEACGGVGYQATNKAELIQALEGAKHASKPTLIDVSIKERAPLPGKIEWDQAIGYSKYLFKNTVENQGSQKDMPALKTILKRLF